MKPNKLHQPVTNVKDVTPYPFRFQHGVRLSYGSTLWKSPVGEDRMSFGMIYAHKTSFAAIFDGHAGALAAEYAADNLEECLRQLIKDPPNDIESALKSAFVTLDKQFSIDHPSDKSGTTGLVVVQYMDQVFTAWVGDSEAYAFDKVGNFVSLTEPIHSLRDENQRKIITDKANNDPDYIFLNGPNEFAGLKEQYQLWWSSNNTKLTVVIPSTKTSVWVGPPETSITLSRAIGDARFGPILDAEPQVSRFTLSENQVIVSASDGMWDKVTPEEVSACLQDAGIIDLLNDPSIQILENFPTAESEKIKAAIKQVSNQLLQMTAERWADSSRDDFTIVVSWMQSPQANN